MSSLAIMSSFPEDLAATSPDLIFRTTAQTMAATSISHGTAHVYLAVAAPNHSQCFLLCAAVPDSAASSDVAAHPVPVHLAALGTWFYSFALNERVLIYLCLIGLVDDSVTHPRALDVARLPSSYPPVGGSTASMGKSLSVLPMRDVVARVGLERTPSLRFAVWVAPSTWIAGAVGLLLALWLF